MSEGDIVRLTLLFSALAAVFGGLAVSKPLFKLVWNHWIRYRWYRSMVALREDRTYARADLPTGFKDALLLVLHPMRSWHGRPTATQSRIERFARCPFYRPGRCVYKLGPGLNVCQSSTQCGTLEHQYDPGSPHSRPNRLVRVVRGRPARRRAHRFAETLLPCSGCGKTSGRLWVKTSWSEHEGRTSPVALMMFFMEGDRWLCPSCFGVPHDLHDLLPTVD